MIFNAVDNITDRTTALQVHKNHANLLNSRLPLSIEFRIVFTNEHIDLTHLEVCYSLLFFEFVERVVCPVIIYKITFGYENIDIQFLQGDNCVDILLTSTTHNNGVIKLCKHNIVLRNSC